ncbi:MAG: DUF2029 domain-containing protein [Thermoleophilia bacterium]|nr:DUF2029 domain-containing protein [Thermoleophilia bacterium]
MAAALLVAFGALVVDFGNTVEFGGADLRNRVVGSRLLVSGHDPYHFKWRQGMSERLLDPNGSPTNPITLTTATPALLTLQAPFAWIDYKILRVGWLAAQWGLLLLALALFSRMAGTPAKARAVWISGLLVTASPFWRLHVERGQVIILFVFMLAAAAWVLHRHSRHSAAIAGVILGFTVALRPPMIFILLPMAIFREWRLLKGAAAGAAA